MRCALGAMGVLIWRGMMDVIGVADVPGALGVVGVCVSGRVYWGTGELAQPRWGGIDAVCGAMVTARACVSVQCSGRYARVV